MNEKHSVKIGKLIYEYIVVVLITRLCLPLSDSMDHKPPGPTVHGISQARILEWVVISFSRESSQPRDPTRVSCIVGGLFTTEPPGKTLNVCTLNYLIFPK